MKKTLILASVVLTFAACKNDKTEVKTDNTVIETPTDTMTIDTDTVTSVEAEKQIDGVEISKQEEEKATEVKIKGTKELKVEYACFGDKVVSDEALTKEEMLKKYKGLKTGDTINVKFKSKITGVCQKKGCWMSLDLPGEKESFVKFKDYAFFVPLNAADQDAVVSGKAFVSEVSVAQQRHYAKDAGDSEAEIAKITQPKVTYGFMADGVLISK